jgi:acetyltransferase-like isoleucine patch superfamily enzyme
MIKKLFSTICYRIYTIGRFEYESRDRAKYEEAKKGRLIIDSSSYLSPLAKIENNTGLPDRIKIGSNCSINGYVLVYNHGGSVNIGNDCFIGPDTRIWAASKIEIGNRVLISHDVNIHDNNSHPLNAQKRHLDFTEIFKYGLPKTADYSEKPVVIEDDAWIGFNAIILKGVTIGKGAIVGSGTIVTRDVPPYAVVVGNPARVVKYTD